MTTEQMDWVDDQRQSSPRTWPRPTPPSQVPVADCTTSVEGTGDGPSIATLRAFLGALPASISGDVVVALTTFPSEKKWEISATYPIAEAAKPHVIQR